MVPRMSLLEGNWPLIPSMFRSTARANSSFPGMCFRYDVSCAVPGGLCRTATRRFSGGFPAVFPAGCDGAADIHPAVFRRVLRRFSGGFPAVFRRFSGGLCRIVQIYPAVFRRVFRRVVTGRRKSTRRFSGGLRRDTSAARRVHPRRSSWRTFGSTFLGGSCWASAWAT